MDGPQAAKRRRVVTTCSECHRRKQKCDRRKPCNICLARKVSDRCSYSDEAVSPHIRQNLEISRHEKPRVADTQVQSQENVAPLTLQELDIAEQIGYSPMKGSNVFTDLQQQLLQEDSTGQLDLANTPSRTVKSEQWEDQFWNLVAELPPKLEMEELVKIYLNDLNWYFGILEGYYVQRISESWHELCRTGQSALKDFPRDVLYFPALLFQICASALHFIPPESPAIKALIVEEMDDRDCLSEKYSKRGMDIMGVLGRHRPTMISVQHDLMRASWLKDCGRGTESWHALSNSIRQAQELNMHLQARVDQRGTVAEILNRLWYDEYKRRVWMILFMWDSHMSLMLGRPRLINLDDCDIQVPIDCKFPEDPSTAVPTAIHTSGEIEIPTPLSSHLFRYSVSHLIHEMKAKGASKRYPKDYAPVETLHEKAVSLMDGVPAFLRSQNPDKSWDARFQWIPRQREQVLYTGTGFLLGLHRPHIHSSPKSRKAAIQAAITILDSQQRVFEITKTHQYRLFSLAFYTIDAGFFLSLTSIMYPSTDREFSRKVDVCLQQSIKRLEILENHNAIAGSSLKLLKHCYQLLQEASSTRASIPATIEPSNEVFETVEQSTDIHQGSNSHEPSSGVENFHPIGFHAHNFSEQMDFPSTAVLAGFPNINEFDSSYWIEQMDQIPFVSMDPNLDGSWNFPFGI